MDGVAGGLSTDAGTLVLSNFSNAFLRKSDFLVLDGADLSTVDRIRLPGSFTFDAISPDGSMIYLIDLMNRRDPTDYRVRTYDVGAERLLRRPVVDPANPDEQMGGYPYARTTSPDGRWVYTAYSGGKEPFVHALDTVGRTAVCVDLGPAGVRVGRRSTLIQLSGRFDPPARAR